MREQKPDEATVTAVHESAHVVVGLSLGHVPDNVYSGNGSGRVSYTCSMSADAALQIGIAGNEACLALLGVDRTGSESDNAMALDGYQSVVAAGIGWKQRQSLALFMSRRVAELEEPILALANILLKRDNLSRDELASVVRRSPELSRYSHLFPAPRQKPMTMAQAAMANRARNQTKASRGADQLPPGFKFTLK